jgi:hypothetical protein
MKRYYLSFAILVLLILFSINICCSLSDSNLPYIDNYSTQIAYGTFHINDTVNLDVGIYNPINESTSVVIKILVNDVDCFPSNESTMMLPPKTYSSVLEKTRFILIPRQTGNHPLEIQLWWNGTKVDNDVFSFETPPILEASIWWTWLRISLTIVGLIYLVISIRFANPSFHITMESENVKWTVFFLVSSFYWFAAIFFLSMSGIYADYVATSIFSSIGAIHVIIGIGWALGVISLGFCFFKRYDWSNRFSTFVLLFLLLSVVWDWFFFPENPFPQWSPIVILVFGALLQVFVETLIKGAFAQLKSRIHRNKQ